MTSSPFGVKMLKQAYSGLMLLLEVLLLLVAPPFLVEVSYVFVAGVWEAELLVAWAPAGCIVFPRVMKLINTVLSFFCQLFSFSCFTLS